MQRTTGFSFRKYALLTKGQISVRGNHILNNMSSSDESRSSKKHKHRHADDSERFKRHGLSSIRRRKIATKITYWTMVALAIGVVLAYIYVYINT